MCLHTTAKSQQYHQQAFFFFSSEALAQPILSFLKIIFYPQPQGIFPNQNHSLSENHFENSCYKVFQNIPPHFTSSMLSTGDSWYLIKHFCWMNKWYICDNKSIELGMRRVRLLWLGFVILDIGKIASGFFFFFRNRGWSAPRFQRSCPVLCPVQFSSVAQLCPTLCNLMNRSTPGLPVHHKLPEFTQTHAHRVGDAIQPSHLLSSPSPSAPNPSQHQDLFQWVSSSHQVAKVLEFQLQHQSFQWTPRTDLL